MMLSNARPLPSMLIRTHASFRRPVNDAPVYWLPWSVLKISGCPPSKARSNVATQKSASKVIDRSQLSTYRLCQSITATRYTKPPRRRMYVMSLHQTWSGVSIDSPDNR